MALEKKQLIDLARANAKASLNPSATFTFEGTQLSADALNKTFIKVDDKVEWFGGLNTLTYNGAIIDLGFIPNNGLLITDEVKLLQEEDIRISESTPMDSYCYWFKPSTKELWLCSSGMKVKKLQLPSFRVKSNGISVKEIVKYFETQEEVRRD